MAVSTEPRVHAAAAINCFQLIESWTSLVFGPDKFNKVRSYPLSNHAVWRKQRLAVKFGKIGNASIRPPVGGVFESQMAELVIH
ncbi:hypothetical protein J4E85_010020 [Alternaria conjuncta]|uniref:uncharacterized protein n=1 Tax=Alternaria conjuncta TaxID=181017 RepID=UPI00221F8728|nr:uncharacterized protein J4E85_010020 [Alternaria conjuncta]KAI4917501.1 hypothetical protein J4E85_010020 [Alternaria conjuncta]